MKDYTIMKLIVNEYIQNILITDKFCSKPIGFVINLDQNLTTNDILLDCELVEYFDFTKACNSKVCKCRGAILDIIFKDDVLDIILDINSVQKLYIILSRLNRLAYKWRKIKPNEYLQTLHNIENIIRICTERILELKFQKYKIREGRSEFIKPGTKLDKPYWGRKWLICNHIRTIVIRMLTINSRIHRYQKFNKILNMSWSNKESEQFNPKLKVDRSCHTKGIIYLAFSTNNKPLYIGMSTIGLKGRVFQHLLYMSNMNKEDTRANQIPFYNLCRNAHDYTFFVL